MILSKVSRKFSETLDATKTVDIISALVTKVTKHSLLESLYIYKYFQHYYSYIVVDKATKNMISFDCGDFKTSRFNVEKLMKETGGGFEYLFLTHGHPNHIQGALEWQRIHPDLKICGGQEFFGGMKVVKDGDIFFVGDLSVYCMHTPGHTPYDFSYVVTEASETSDKTPFVFTGDTLYIGGCGPVVSGTYGDLYASLKKLKTLPNETMIFPGHENALENLTYAKLLEQKNEFIENKLEWAKQNKGNMTVGSVMSEERLYNPFLRSDQKYFQNLTGETDPVKCFEKMRKVMEKLIEQK